MQNKTALIVDDSRTACQVLRLMLELEPRRQQEHTSGVGVTNPWRVVALTSSGWLVVLALMTAGFLSALERQERQIELLLQRTNPAFAKPAVPEQNP